MNRILKAFVFLPLVGLLGLTVGCTSGSSGGGRAVSYQGAGSNYSITLNADRTFSLTESDSSLAISGTWTKTSAYFYKMTVTTTNNAGTVPVGSLAYGVEIPGVVFLLKPANCSSCSVIAAVKAGDCPTGSFGLNWIVSNLPTGDINSQDVFGTFLYNISTNSASLPAKYRLDNTPMGPGTVGAFSCSNGVGTAGAAKMYFTQVGAAVVNSDTTNAALASFIIAMPQVAIGGVGNLGTYYSGFLFGESISVPQAVRGTFSGNTLNVDVINPDSDALTGEGSGLFYNINTDNPSIGFMTASLRVTGSSNIRAQRCMAVRDIASSGRHFVLCAGQDPSDSTKLYNLALISR